MVALANIILSQSLANWFHVKILVTYSKLWPASHFQVQNHTSNVRFLLEHFSTVNITCVT